MKLSDSMIVCRLYQNNIDKDEETTVFKMTKEIQTKSKEKFQEKRKPETEETVQPELEPLDISVHVESRSANYSKVVLLFQAHQTT